MPLEDRTQKGSYELPKDIMRMSHAVILATYAEALNFNRAEAERLYAMVVESGNNFLIDLIDTSRRLKSALSGDDGSDSCGAPVPRTPTPPCLDSSR